MNNELVPTEEEEISEDDAARMTFIGHLGELRTRMVKTSILLLVLCFGGYVVSGYVIEAIATPLRDEGIKWVSLTPIEIIVVKMKMALLVAVTIGGPYIVYHVCAFVFPGLRPKEKKAVMVVLAGGTVLGATGIAMAFFGVFPIVLPYLMAMTPDFVETQLQLSTTMTIIVKGMMGFAIAFQFPMVIFVLVFMGILTPDMLKEHRKVAILGVFVGAAILTPPDPFSLLMLAGPLVVLYEFSIWVSHLIVRQKADANGV